MSGFDTEIKEKLGQKLSGKIVFTFLPLLFFLISLVIGIISLTSSFRIASEQPSQVNAIYFSPIVKDSCLLLQKVVFNENGIAINKIDTIIKNNSAQLTNYNIVQYLDNELNLLKHKPSERKIPGLWLTIISLAILILGVVSYPFLAYHGLEIINTSQKKLIQKSDNIYTTMQDVAAWTFEPPKKVPIRVTNMYDFFIHIPFFVAKSYGFFNKQHLNLTTVNQRNDKNAILELNDGISISITDPKFAYEFKQDIQENDLIFLAPLIVGTPIWCIEKKVISNEDNYKPKVLFYGTESTTYDVATKYLTGVDCNLKMNEIEEVSIEKFISENFSNLDFSKTTELSEVKEHIKNLIDNEHFLLAFQTLLSIALHTPNDATETDSLPDQIIKLFRSYDYLFLTEPEKSVAAKILKAESEAEDAEYFLVPHDKLNHKNKVFTAIVTTKRCIQLNPVGVLRFLRALKLGIYKTHNILSLQDPEEKKNLLSRVHDETLKVLPDNFYLAKSRENITLDMSNNFYPTELELYFKDGDNISQLRDTIQHDIEDMLLKTENNGSKELDAKIKYIIERL